MKKNAYADSTIRATGKRPRSLQRNTNLNKPEQVETYIANKQCSNGFKETLIETYDLLMKSKGQTWNKPFYQRYDKMQDSNRRKLNMLISEAQPPMALFLSMSKDLGTRPIELTWLKLSDIDLERGIVNVTSAKHCTGRTLKLKTTTLGMLKSDINREELKLCDRIFPATSDNVCNLYRKLRNRLTEKLQEPTFKTIRLYDFRHFKATMEYQFGLVSPCCCSCSL
jgi:integrase